MLSFQDNYNEVSRLVASRSTGALGHTKPVRGGRRLGTVSWSVTEALLFKRAKGPLGVKGAKEGSTLHSAQPLTDSAVMSSAGDHNSEDVSLA